MWKEAALQLLQAGKASEPIPNTVALVLFFGETVISTTVLPSYQKTVSILIIATSMQPIISASGNNKCCRISMRLRRRRQVSCYPAPSKERRIPVTIGNCASLVQSQCNPYREFTLTGKPEVTGQGKSSDIRSTEWGVHTYGQFSLGRMFGHELVAGLIFPERFFLSPSTIVSITTFP